MVLQDPPGTRSYTLLGRISQMNITLSNILHGPNQDMRQIE